MGSSYENGQAATQYFCRTSVNRIIFLRWGRDHQNTQYSIESFLQFLFSATNVDSLCTKRSILLKLARIHDPLGFLTPFTFFRKHFIQVIWIRSWQWAQSPSSEIVNCLKQCKAELLDLQNLHVPRHLLRKSYVKCELHGFSEKGYAAVTYFRFLYLSGQAENFFICSKSEVANGKKEIQFLDWNCLLLFSLRNYFL